MVFATEWRRKCRGCLALGEEFRNGSTNVHVKGTMVKCYKEDPNKMYVSLVLSTKKIIQIQQPHDSLGPLIQRH